MQIMKRISFWRQLIQWCFLLWCLFLGWRFTLFVRHFETRGAEPLVARPPGVEGFLPIGALVSLKNWLVNGVFDTVHPAALVIFLTVLGLSLLTRKSFCSWLCPVGTLSEALHKLGRRLLGRNFRMWRWLDVLLRGVKYALLAFFLKTILLDMPGAALQGFLRSPYWAVSDVKMLHFFLGPSITALAVVAALGVLSLFFPNFWCRYLCPYGALLGLGGMLSPLKVRRSEDSCTGCAKCSRACPAALPVHEKSAVRSPECTACLTCVESCPRQGTLEMKTRFFTPPLPRYGFAILVLLLFGVGVGAGMLTGNWHSALSYQDYQYLIPLTPRLGH